MKPIKRIDFIRKLRNLKFKGPFSGTKHEFIIYNNNRISIPSNKEYSIPQVKFIIKEVEIILERIITDDEWNNL